MRSRPTSSMLRITFFSIFTSWESFFARSGPNWPAVCLRRAWPISIRISTRGSKHYEISLKKLCNRFCHCEKCCAAVLPVLLTEAQGKRQHATKDHTRDQLESVYNPLYMCLALHPQSGNPVYDSRRVFSCFVNVISGGTDRDRPFRRIFRTLCWMVVEEDSGAAKPWENC